MGVFIESDLAFTFPDDWVVKRFDTMSAYRSVSGHGLKGVDFLCLAPPAELWLVEVKNYRTRSAGFRADRRHPSGMAKHVGRKFADTKRLIRVVDRALRRDWFTQLRLRWYAWFSKPRPLSLLWFWKEAERRSRSPQNLTCLLWLETPEMSPDYERATALALDEWLEPGNRMIIAETKRPHAAFPITAQPIE